MNNEKPVTGEANTPPVQESTPPKTEKKPVVIYIMILFIAAFLLMALSFAMHQRSNQEALGQLETSFNATIQDMQSSQERILALEKEVSELEDQVEDLEVSANTAKTDQEAAQAQLEAMEQLYCLQQKYSAGRYEDCKALIDLMESSGSVNLLEPTPITTEGGSVTAPFVRFQQLKNATLEKLAEPEE